MAVNLKKLKKTLSKIFDRHFQTFQSYVTLQDLLLILCTILLLTWTVISNTLFRISHIIDLIFWTFGWQSAFIIKHCLMPQTRHKFWPKKRGFFLFI